MDLLRSTCIPASYAQTGRRSGCSHSRFSCSLFCWSTRANCSPDGKYLAYSDWTGLHLKLIETGETRSIPQPEGLSVAQTYWWPNGWFPDSTKFVATADDRRISAWAISTIGGPPRKLRDDADVWSVSPNGSLIAFGTERGFAGFRDVWLMGAQGEAPLRLVPRQEDVEYFWAAWSPDGSRIAYWKQHRVPDKADCPIESRDLKGGQPTVLSF